MELSESMYQVFKLAVKTHAERGDNTDGWYEIHRYRAKVLKSQCEQMAQELVDEGVLTLPDPYNGE